MTFNKRFFLYLCIILSTCSFTQGSEIDPIAFFNSVSSFVSKPKALTSATTTRANPIVHNTLAAFFTTTSVAEALDKPLYKKTYNPQFKNIIQSPAFLNWTKPNKSPKTWSFNTFLTRDYSRNYTDNSNSSNPKHITSYIDLDSKTLLEVFENIKNDPTVALQISNFGDFSVPDVFKIFKPMKLQEHKIGVIGHYHTTWGDINVDVQLPFLWAERNFYFNDEEKEAIYNNELMQMLGEVDEWAFAQEYLISDQLGFGTLKVTFTKNLIDRNFSKSDAGITLYFPTEVAIKKSLLGTYRNLDPNRPKLNFEDLLASVSGTTSGLNNWEEKIAQYFGDAFLRFTTNILHSPLGFDNHPGIAFHISSEYYLSDQFTLKAYSSLELLAPMKKDKLIMDKVLSDNEVSTIYADAVDATARVNIIEIAITDRLFPELAVATIFPGPMFSGGINLQYEKGNKSYIFGYLSSIQLKEKILSHSLSQDVIWDIEAAEKPFAGQIKLFGRFNKKVQYKNHDLNFSLYLDYNVTSESLGNDFLINFEIQGTF